MNDEMATQGDAYREMVGNIGSDNPDQCWILTPFDTWERNPAYTGPDQPHPEDDRPEPVALSDSYDERRAQFDAQFTEWKGDSDGTVGCD
jgi:hypothetical protein